MVVAASRKNRKETVASRLVVSKPGKSSGSPWDLAALESATRSCRSHGAAQPSRVTNYNVEVPSPFTILSQYIMWSRAHMTDITVWKGE